MTSIRSAISCNLDQYILSASLPLFESEKVEAIEWSFDTLYKWRNIPEWFVDLLTAFGTEKRLIGHGVYFSMFSGQWLPEQKEWLKHLEKVTSTFHFDHMSEHFGFMTGEDFHKGAPISIPFNSSTLAIGRDRLMRMYNACHCPVGLENLAFSYSLDEVKIHGEFLEKLVEPVNGFIILDLHNLYCQAHNFNIEFQELLRLYPLHRVREIHISGGSWENAKVLPGKKIRRDTHDDAVPQEVFDFLKNTIPQCANLKYVVLEQLSNGLESTAKQIAFQHDFFTMSQIVKQQQPHDTFINKNKFFPLTEILTGLPLEDETLYQQQLTLSNILETAGDYAQATALLQNSILAKSDWEVEKWEPAMLETAIAIAQKWKNGFD